MVLLAATLVIMLLISPALTAIVIACTLAYLALSQIVYPASGSPQLATFKPAWNDRKFHNLQTSTVWAAGTYAF